MTNYIGNLNPEPSLKMLYHLEGNANDSSGNSNNGTASNVTFGTSYGKIGQGGSFNGSSSEITTTTQYTNPQVLSLFAWIKTSATSGCVLTFANPRTGGNGTYDRLILIDSNGHLVFYVYDGAPYYLTSTVTVNDNKWHWVGITMNSGVINMYIDGKFNVTMNHSGYAYNGYWRIGNNTAGTIFNGSIDEVAYYNEVKSASWIKKYYYYWVAGKLL